MTYEQFKVKLGKGLQERLPEGATEVSYQIFAKINNEETECFFYRPEDKKRTCPVIYIKDWYYEYMDGKSMEDILNICIELWNDSCNINKIANEIMEMKKEDIIPCICSIEGNKRILESVPHRKICDFAIMYRLGKSESDALYSSMVTNETAEKMQLTEQELYEIAYGNVKDNIEYISLNEALDNLLEELPDLHAPFKVLRNNPWSEYGASVLGDFETLQNIAEKEKSNLYILPSSRYEVLVMKSDEYDRITGEYLYKIVCEINRIEVAPKDRLTDNIYFYNYKTKSLKALF